MKPKRRLKVQYRRIEELKPNPRNPRTHSREQIRMVGDSMDAFGFTTPVLIDDKDVIIAGHARVAAGRLRGMKTVPTITLEDLTEAQKRAYIIADNKLAEQAGWDPEILAIDFEYLTAVELDFDATLTGFSTAEIDVLLRGHTADPADAAADEVPAINPAAPPVTRAGDRWCLGRHALLCGDATQAAAFEELMGGTKAQMVFIDPPFNVSIEGHVGGLGAIKHRDFMMAAGEMSEAEFTLFLVTAFRLLAARSANGAIHYVFMDWRHLYEAIAAGRAAGFELKNLCVWNKDNGGMGSFYRSKHELVLVFKAGDGPHINNFELGQHGRYRTNVWDYPGMSSLREGRLDDLALHPTVKPVALVADAILDCSRRGGLILDCFAGSGTTLIAAQKTDRRAYAMELDPIYVDTAVRRWEAYTGKQARHAGSGQTFAAVQRARLGAAKRPPVKPGSTRQKSANRRRVHNAG